MTVNAPTPAPPAALDTVAAVETPEGIHLSLRTAGPAPRLLAALLDQLIRMGLWFLAALASPLFRGLGPALFFLAIFLIEWIYPIAFELGMGGATPGKRALKLQVVMDNGLPVTPAASITRNLLRTADFLPALYAIGALCLLLRPDFKRLGDLAAGTLVVHVENVSLHGELPAAGATAPAQPLSLAQQSAVLSWAGREATLTPERLEELARLARPILPTDGGAGAQGDSARLMAVAHWLAGRRGEAGS